MGPVRTGWGGRPPIAQLWGRAATVPVEYHSLGLAGGAVVVGVEDVFPGVNKVPQGCLLVEPEQQKSF